MTFIAEKLEITSVVVFPNHIGFQISSCEWFIVHIQLTPNSDLYARKFNHPKRITNPNITMNVIILR